MTKSQQKPAPTGRAWNTPRLVRIGTIADVAGAPPKIVPGNPNREMRPQLTSLRRRPAAPT